MVLKYSNPGELGSKVHDFVLPGVDGKKHQLSDFESSRAIVFVFMCNHCPYVKATIHRINSLAQDFQSRGVAFIGINSNDSVKYPEDSFEAMKVFSNEHELVFPYLWDETQEVARVYGAVCTPEFFVYSEASNGHSLQYRGRLDDHWKDENQVKSRDLALALEQILRGQSPDPDQKPSMGCSIKWR